MSDSSTQSMASASVPEVSAFWLRTVAGVVLSALSGTLATLAFPPFGIWPLIFIAWVPMIVAQHWVLPARLSGIALGVGIGSFFAGYSGLTYSGFELWVWFIPVVVGALIALLASGERHEHEKSHYARFIFAFPLAYAAVDFLRGFAPGIATRGYPAYALFSQPWLIQPVSLFSIHALNLLILCINWTIAAGVLVLLHSRLGDVRQAISLRAVGAGAAAVLTASVAWTVLSLAMLDRTPARVTVAAIQPGLSSQDDAELKQNITQTEAAARKGAKLIVWREKALRFDPRVTRTEEFRSLARRTGAYIALGYQVLTPKGQRNEATVIAPDGRFLGVYGKQHPAIVFPDDQTSITASAVPVYATPFGRLATIICFDFDFTDTAREAARRGAQIVAVPSWDPADDATKHYDLLVFRAVENRLTMIKAETKYDSTIIDPYGRILSKAVTPEGARATLLANVPLGTGKSLLVTLGDLWGWLIVAGAFVVPLSLRVRL